MIRSYVEPNMACSDPKAYHPRPNEEIKAACVHALNMSTEIGPQSQTPSPVFRFHTYINSCSVLMS